MNRQVNKIFFVISIIIGLCTNIQVWALDEINLVESTKKQCATLVKEATKILDEWEGGKDSLAIAKQKLDAVLKLDSKFAPAYVELARYVIKAGAITRDWQDRQKRSKIFLEAMEYLRKAKEYDQNYYRTYVLLGYVLVQLRDFPTAESFFQHAATIDNTDGWLNVNWGEMLLLKEDLVGAEKKLNYVLQSTTIEARIKKQASFFLINLYGRTGQTSKQNDTYLRLIEIDPNDSWALHQYANFCLYSLADYEKAIRYQRQAMERSRMVAAVTGLAEALYVKWADYLINKKEHDSAKEILQQATMLMPDAERVFRKLSKKEHIAKFIIPAFATIGIDLNEFNDGETLLIKAARQSQHDLITSLVQSGADVNLRGKDGVSALHISANAQDIGTVEYLLAHGADVNATDDMGRTPLMWSLAKLEPESEIDIEVIKVLLKNGADPNLKSFDGWVPLKMATENQLDEIVEMLKAVGAKE